MFGKNGERKSKGWYLKNKYYGNIILEWFDEGKDFNILLDFLIKISNGKKIFISTSGLEGFNKDSFLNTFVKAEKQGEYKLQLSAICQNTFNEEIFKNKATNIYFFLPESGMNWVKYIGERTINPKKEMKNGNLYANIILTEETMIEIMEAHEIKEMSVLIDKLCEKGYKIRRV